MCVLPNIQVLDLEEFSQRRRKQKRKAKAQPLKMVMLNFESMQTAV